MALDDTDYLTGEDGLTLTGDFRLLGGEVDETDPENPLVTRWTPSLTLIAAFLAGTLGGFAGYDWTTLAAAEDGIATTSRFVIDYDGAGATVQAATGEQLVEFVAAELDMDKLPFIGAALEDYRRTDTAIAEDQITGLPTRLTAIEASVVPFTALATALPALVEATDEAEARTALELGAWATLGFTESAMVSPTDAVKFTVDTLGDGTAPGTLTLAQIRQFVADEMVIDDLPFIAEALTDYRRSDTEIAQDQITDLPEDIAALQATAAVIDEAATDILDFLGLPDLDAVKSWLNLGTAAFAATGDFLSSLSLAFDDLTDSADILAALLQKADPAFDGQMQAPLGSLSAPSMAFLGDLNTGFFHPNSDQIGAVANGAISWLADQYGLVVGANTTLSGQAKIYATGSLTVAASAGIFSAPAYASSVEGGYGFLSSPSLGSAFTLTTLAHYQASGVTLNGGAVTTQYGFLGGSGLSGATTNIVYGSTLTAASGRYGLYFAGTAANYVAGTFASLGSYSATTASAANMNIASNGDIARSTSSGRYKRDVEDMDPAAAIDALGRLRPVWYRSTCAADRDDWSWYGLIAEEVAEVDPRLVHWGRPTKAAMIEDADGSMVETLVEDAEAPLRPEGVAYDRIVPHLIVANRALAARVAALEARLAA